MSLILSGTDGLSDVDGTAATPAVRGTDANTGIFFPAADTIAFAEGGAESMRIDSSGNVGIGTTTPGTTPAGQLVVAGANVAFATNDNANVVVRSTDAAATNKGGMLGFAGASDSGNLTFATIKGAKEGVDSGYLAFATRSAAAYATERMRIDSSGNVGIGTTAPSSVLNVKSGAPVFRLETTGTVSSTGTASYAIRDSTGADVFSYGYLGLANCFQFSTIPAAGFMRFLTGAQVEAMRINSSGIVSIGINTNYFGERLSIYQSSTTAPVTFAYAPSASFTGSAHIIQSEAASGTTWKLIDGRSASGIIRFNVFGNGTVQNSTGTYTTISDAKLKENVVDANPQLNKLMQTRVVNYNLIDDDLKQIGWVAQELETIFPSMVFESPDKTPEGEDLGTTTKGVKLTVFIPIIVKAIQEQQALITALTARITALENK